MVYPIPHAKAEAFAALHVQPVTEVPMLGRARITYEDKDMMEKTNQGKTKQIV